MMMIRAGKLCLLILKSPVMRIIIEYSEGNRLKQQLFYQLLNK